MKIGIIGAGLIGKDSRKLNSSRHQNKIADKKGKEKFNLWPI